ncbi:MAG: geranylgeranylglyceryl/heptaprenylglyceryl phosphate synthase [Candidatus Aenigmarchaeota archaeon]|nr:geranylgeranylglyceryl/heptaprenylglyceryl phosphate synthase [Candidatus Aenigmarchaeota archaeon]
MKPGKVEKYIYDKIEREGALLLSLIDPDKQPFDAGAKIAELSCNAGADLILVGGSIGAQGLILDKTTKMIREKVNIPIVLFPGNVGTITPFADATYFMYVLNSREVYWMSTVQIQGAPVIKRMGIEPIPTAYIVLEPGRAVGWISNANMIPRDRGDLAAATALAGEYMGARLVVTDSGSGAPEPAPPQLISAVKSMISIPYFYGGGCRTSEQAYNIIKAGADGVQIGTAFEMLENDPKKLEEKIKNMVKSVKTAAKDRIKKKKPETKPLLPSIKIDRFLKFQQWLKRKNEKKFIVKQKT